MKPSDFNKLHQYIVRRLMLMSVQSSHTGRKLSKDDVERVIDDECNKLGLLLTHDEGQMLRQALVGPNSRLSLPAWLNVCLVDEHIHEIVIMGPERVVVRRQRDVVRLGDRFDDKLHLLYVLNLLLKPTGKYLNEHSPAVSVRFPDESEMIAIIPPLAGDTLFASIRPKRGR